MTPADFAAHCTVLIKEGALSEHLETRLAAATLAALLELRADLKRRSARDLASTGAIPPVRTARASSAKLPTHFPEYGRSSGKPILGAPKSDLDFYGDRARAGIDTKTGWRRDNDVALVAAIDAELARQVTAPPASQASQMGPGDDDTPF